MKRLITYSCMVIFAMGSMAQNQKDEAQMNRFISGLMKKMTLEEKVGQLSQCSGGFATGPDNTRISRTEDISKGLIGSLLNVSGAANTRKYQEAAMKSRLQIPLLFGLDVIHGYRTGFPLPLAEAASFDLDAIERGSRCAAKEAAAAGLHWTFAPMVDISWDARWGRVMEGAGEDPYYGSLVAKARVHGLQGDDLSKENTILSCIKHFAGYGAAIAGKDYNSVDMSMGQFANFYMPPYKAGAEAGAATFMSAFNDFNNEPSTGSTFLLRELLKNQWGFKGFVVSDWGSVGEMMNHRYAKDEKEAAYKGIKAGLDMEMVSECYSKNLVSLVKEGKVSIKLVDDAVRRILEQKYKLGLFDDPFRYCDEERERTVIGSQESRKEACYVSERSIVLLKNENSVLPLSSSIKKVALIGALSKSQKDMCGAWSCAEVGKVVTLYEAMEKRGVDINYNDGYDLKTNKIVNLDQTLAAARQSDVVIVAMGEQAWESGEMRSKGDIPTEPAYPFGYGLSYTTFNYSDVKLLPGDGKGTYTRVAVTVTNTGKYEGEEVVQLYVRDEVASITRPIKELKGFEKIKLNPGESKTVTFDVKDEQLGFYNNQMKFIVEKGDFTLMVGGNSRDLQEIKYILN